MNEFPEQVEEEHFMKGLWEGVAGSAVESFLSAISAEGWHWLANPLQSTPPIEDVDFYDDEESYKIAIEQWNLAESRTFKNPYIFIKD